jgi:hypothetical protein
MNLNEKAPELLEIAEQLRKAQRAIGADQGMEAVLSGGSVLTLIGYDWDGGIKTALVDVNNGKVYVRD